MHPHPARHHPLQMAGQPEQALVEGQVGGVANEVQRGLRQPLNCQIPGSSEKPGICDLRFSPARLGYE